MDPEEVRRILDRSLEVPAPPSSASILTAVALGRRRVHRRRLAAGASAGIMVIMIAGLVLALQPRQSAVPAMRASTTSAMPPPTSSPPTPASARFDPRFIHAHIGWIPPGLQLASREASALTYASSYQYKPPSGRHADGPVVTLRLSQPGQPEPESDAPTTFASAVNGRGAVWIQPPGEDATTAILRWSFVGGVSATLTVAGLRGGVDVQQVAHRIADSVRIGTFGPITTPFHLASVPADMSLSSVWVQIQDDASRAWESGLTFAGGGAGVNVHVFPKPDCACGNKFDTVQNTTINGTPAWMSDTSVTLYFGRVIAEITLTPDRDRSGPANDPTNHATVASPNLADLAAGMTVYPNRADWRAPLG
jgi:hypothetical protein